MCWCGVTPTESDADEAALEGPAEGKSRTMQ